MPNGKPKVVRPPSKKVDADSDVIAFKIDGEKFVLRMKEVTGLDAKHFRAGVGMTINEAMSIFAAAVGDDEAKVHVDIDLIAGLVFLAKRQAGNKTVKFDSVASAISYGSDVELGDEEDDEVEDPQT